jgi:HD domain
VATFLVRAAIVLVPVAVGLVVGAVVVRLLPTAEGGLDRALWLVAVLGASSASVVMVEQATRRLGPLTLLLRLGLVFPGEAPKRFGVALRAIRPQRLALEAEVDRLGAEQSLSLLAALLAHDRRTRGHSERVAAYATMIAAELGIKGEERARLQWGALLHDVGKLEVPARILRKPAPLDDVEWRIMGGHPAFGGRLVDPLRPWLGDALSAVDGHHERWDGGGYPYRRPAADLPIAARVTAVADAFETMTAARPYKKPMPVGEARQEIARCAGHQFDPEVARAFLALSVPRLWVLAGPLTWLAQIPVLGVAAAQTAAAAAAPAVTAAAVVGSAMVAGGVAPVPAIADQRAVVATETTAAEEPGAAPAGEDGGDDETVTPLPVTVAGGDPASAAGAGSAGGSASHGHGQGSNGAGGHGGAPPPTTTVPEDPTGPTTTTTTTTVPSQGNGNGGGSGDLDRGGASGNGNGHGNGNGGSTANADRANGNGGSNVNADPGNGNGHGPSEDPV